MTREQAAKLAQAYQWLSEGKEMEGQYCNGAPWKHWNGHDPNWLRFRIKPELLELWVNVYPFGPGACHSCAKDAHDTAGVKALRVAVHMREVRDEPTT